MDPKRLLKALRVNAGFPPDLARADLDRAQAALGAMNPSLAQGLPGRLALALVEASVDLRNPIFAEALSESPDRGVAKAAKKALYRLRSLGVSVPEPGPAPANPTPNAAGTPVATESLPALLSPLTGNGERALLLVRPLPGGGLELAQVVVSDELGVLGLELHETSRSSFRKTLRVLRSDAQKSAVEIPESEGRALLAHAVALSLERSTPFPDGFDSTLRRLGITPRRHEPELPAPEPDDPARAHEAAALHEEPELRGWLPPVGELQTFSHKVEEVLVSPLYIDEQQRRAQLGRVIDGIAQGFLTPPVRRLYARRLWSMADYLERTGRAESAGVARAEARRLFHAPEGVPSAFIQRMFEKVLALSAAMRPQGAPPGPGGQPAPPAGPPSQERRSPGGLILP